MMETASVDGEKENVEDKSDSKFAFLIHMGYQIFQQYNKNRRAMRRNRTN
jgi:hypothetical protein